MKATRSVAGRGLVVLSMVGAALLISSCQSPPAYEPLPAGVPNPIENLATSDIFRVGDSVLVNFSGSIPDVILQPHRESIKEDGKITPPLVGSVVAAGRTPGDLQAELQEKYKKLYNNLNVTVIPADRYYYVSGEVRRPGPAPYLGQTDIIKAIATAGDFTDFANKKKVRITRADGRTEIVNVQRALDDPQYDVPVYPGDKIVVKRSLF